MLGRRNFGTLRSCGAIFLFLLALGLPAATPPTASPPPPSSAEGTLLLFMEKGSFVAAEAVPGLSSQRTYTERHVKALGTRTQVGQLSGIISKKGRFFSFFHYSVSRQWWR